MVLLNDIKPENSGAIKLVTPPREQPVVSMEEFGTTMTDYIKGTYEFAKAETTSTEMITEVTADMVNGLDKFFTSTKKVFLENVDKNVRILNRDITEAAKKYRRICENENLLNSLKDITIVGYEYTIPEGPIPIEPITNIMYSAEQGIAALDRDREAISTVVEYYCSNIGSSAAMARYRGLLLNKNSISAERYPYELYKFFRNDESRPGDVTFRARKFYDLEWDLKDCKNNIDRCNDEINHVSDMIDNTIRYVHTQPVVLADYESILNAKAKGIDYRRDAWNFGENGWTTRKDKYNAASTIFSKANTSLREANTVAQKYLLAKMKALQEQVAQYNKYFDKILSGKAVQEDTSSHWTDLMDEGIDIAESVYWDSMIDNALTELHVLSEAWYARKLVVEADGAGVQITGAPKAAITLQGRSSGGIIDSISKFIESIIQFITNALNDFSNWVAGTAGTIKNLQANAQYIQNIPPDLLQNMNLTYTDLIDNDIAIGRLKETTIPAKSNNFDLIIPTIEDLQESHKADQNFDLSSNVYKSCFPDLAAINNDPKLAAEFYYHGKHTAMFNSKSGEVQMANATGEACQNTANKMLQFCLNWPNYAKSIEKTNEILKKKVAYHAKELEQLQKAGNTLNIQQNKANFIADRQIQNAKAQQAALAKENWSLSPSFSILEDTVLETSSLAPYMVDRYGLRVEPVSELTQNAIQTGQMAATNMQSGTNPPTSTGETKPADVKNEAPTVVNANKTPEQVQAQKARINQRGNRMVKENSKSQAAAKAIKKAYSIATSVGMVKLNVGKKIFEEYSKTLMGLAESVKQHQGIKAENAANQQAAANAKAQQQQAQQAEIQAIRHQKEINREQRKARAQRGGFFDRLLNG